MLGTLIVGIIVSVLVIKTANVIWLLYGVAKKLSPLPGPPGVPIFKNFFEVSAIEDMISVPLKYQRIYGGMYKLSLFTGLTAVVITDYKILEFMLSSMQVLNKSVVYVFLGKWLGTGLLTSGTEKWKKTRKIITPAFHFQILEQYVDVFHTASDNLIKNLATKLGEGPFDVYPYITLCTLDIICETAMGTKINAQENSESEYVLSVKEMCRIIVDRATSPLKVFDTFYQFSRDYWKEKRHLKVIHGFTNSIIKQRRQELASEEPKTERKRKLAFLDLILQSTIDGRPMTDDEIRQEVDTFMFEGHDTTASGICFALYCLSKYPEFQQKVFQELRDMFGDDRAKSASYKDLQEMKYLEMFIKETFRLYPPVPIFSRQPDRDVEFFGGVLPYYSQLGIFVYGTHRNAEYYPDPERFDPERFTPETQMTRPPFSYLAFSAGPRNCIGQKFAMLEVKMVLSKIVRNFKVVAVDGYEPKIAPLIVLKSLNGFMIQLVERK